VESNKTAFKNMAKIPTIGVLRQKTFWHEFLPRGGERVSTVKNMNKF
jgi:hypothetical protein